MGPKYRLRSIFHPCWTQIFRLFPYWGVPLLVLHAGHTSTWSSTTTASAPEEYCEKSEKPGKSGRSAKDVVVMVTAATVVVTK